MGKVTSGTAHAAMDDMKVVEGVRGRALLIVTDNEMQPGFMPDKE